MGISHRVVRTPPGGANRSGPVSAIRMRRSRIDRTQNQSATASVAAYTVSESRTSRKPGRASTTASSRGTSGSTPTTTSAAVGKRPFGWTDRDPSTMRGERATVFIGIRSACQLGRLPEARAVRQPLVDRLASIDRHPRLPCPGRRGADSHRGNHRTPDHPSDRSAGRGDGAAGRGVAGTELIGKSVTLRVLPTTCRRGLRGRCTWRRATGTRPTPPSTRARMAGGSPGMFRSMLMTCPAPPRCRGSRPRSLRWRGSGR